MAGVIEHLPDIADYAQFWENVRSTMGGAEAQQALRHDANTFTGSLSDGLDPDEDWSDVL